MAASKIRYQSVKRTAGRKALDRPRALALWRFGALSLWRFGALASKGLWRSGAPYAMACEALTSTRTASVSSAFSPENAAVVFTE